MKFEAWYLLLGGLMLAVTFLDRLVRRLPITTTIVYLAVGISLGSMGFGVVTLDPLKSAGFFERVTELAVLVSLFTAGLKLRAPIRDARWKLPVRLAFISMAITVGLITLFGTAILGLSLGAAILLGAILAPTDPVLASDVQLEHPRDRDRLRFGLTGEAGLNDGTAFPFVVLGLGLLGLHDIGAAGWRWLCVDLLWAVGAGLGMGLALGLFVGKFIVYLRGRHEEALGRDEFISLGLIGFAYGAALFVHAYGFLAVFAAGLALRHIEMQAAQGTRSGPESGEKVAEMDSPESSPGYMAGGVLDANEQLERIMEVAVVLTLGIMLSSRHLNWEAVMLALALFFVIRPTSVLLGSIGCKATKMQKTLMGWFGIRGIGSLYYLMYAIQHGLPAPLAERLTSIVLCVITISIFAHGISVTPIMRFYERNKKGGKHSAK